MGIRAENLASIDGLGTMVGMGMSREGDRSVSRLSSTESSKRLSGRKKAGDGGKKEEMSSTVGGERSRAKVSKGRSVREKLEERLSEPPTVDQAAQTEVDWSHPKASGKSRKSGKSEGGSGKKSLSGGQGKSRWQRLDRIFTWGLLVVLVLSVGTVYGVNAWSRRHGAQDLHPLSIVHWTDRWQAFFWYIRQVGGPPWHQSPSLGYEKEIQRAALRYRLRPEILKAIIAVESSFDAWKTDRFGAMGLMQVTSVVAETYGQGANMYLPKTNIVVGAQYLYKQYQRLGQWDKAILAYHTGMRKGMEFSTEQGQEYVRRVQVAMRLYEKDPGHYIRKLVEQSKNNPTKRWSFRQWMQSWMK